jgi:hypothetical protein
MKKLLLLLVLFLISFTHGQDIKLNGTVSAENNQIKNIADPTQAQDATTKNYVDTNISALASNPLGVYFPDGISLGDLISWVWDGTIWEPILSQLNSNVISLVSDPGTDTQIVCEFESILPIQYAVNGDTTGMSVTGLPSGIGHSLSNGILTIAGNANQDVSTQITFNYTVTVPTQDANVNTIASGALIVAPKSSLVLDSGELNQTSCLGEPIEPIVFVIEGKSPNATVTGLPDGVSANIAENKVIISGTPPASLASGSRFDITVQTNSSACAPDTQTGSITVTDCSTCYPTASAGADFSVCAGNPYAVQNASAANYTTLQWTSNGTGTFDTTTTTSPTYVPSNADIANGQVTLTLTTTNSSCTQTQTVVDEMVLTLTQCNSIDVTLQNNNELELFGNAMTYGAQVVTDNMQNISQVGVCYSTAVGPTVDDATITENNSGTDWWAGANPNYELTATGLSPNTTYYVRAFAKTINNNVVYGDQVEVSYTDPNIAEVYNFQTDNNVNLNEVQFDKVTNLTYLYVTENLNLRAETAAPTNRNIKVIRFPNLLSINHINVQRDMTIEKLLFPEVIKFINYNNIYIENTNLMELSFPKLFSIKASWYIQNNPQLKRIDVPNLAEWYNYGGINISSNERLEEISMPSLVSLTTESANRGFYISQNESLTRIDFPKLNGLYHQLGIQSNPLLIEVGLPKCVFLGKGVTSDTGFYLDNNDSLQTLRLDSLEKVYNRINISYNDIFNVSTISNCDFFVVNNDGYDCNFGEVNINGNANNNYCFQDSAKIQQPTLLTTEAIDVTQTTATSGGSVVSPQGTIMKRKGVCWSTSQNPTVEDNVSDNGYGNDEFNSYIFGLLPNTTYHYRAYAEDCNGVYYGNEMDFTTPQ